MKKLIGLLSFLIIFIFSKTAQAYLPFADSPGLADVVENFMNFFLAIVGMLMIIAFIISGIFFFTAGGDESRIEAGKRMLKYAIIGLITTLLAFIIIITLNSLLKAQIPV